MVKRAQSSNRNETLLKVYADLVQLYPDNVHYIKQYAELLLKMDKMTTGIDMMRHLHSQLLKDGEPGQADALVRQYPMIGRVRESDHGQENIHQLLPSFMRNRLWLKLYQKRLREGQYLIHCGDMLDTLYLVCEGELAEFSDTGDDVPVLLNLIQAGDVVAENKLLNAGAHHSDIVANKASVVVKLPRKKMMAALLAEPVLQTILARKVEHRRLVRFISSSPVLQIIPLDMRQHLAEDSYVQDYPAATTIHKTGETLQHVDLIVQGEACYQWLDQGTSKHLTTLKAGALIGETSAIHDTGCPADMVTRHGVTIVHISYTAFINVVEAYPPLRQKLTAYTEAQRVQLMGKLNELQTQEI